MIHNGAIVLGLLIGAGVGVLLAPDKGSVTRNKIKEEGKDIKDQISKFGIASNINWYVFTYAAFNFFPHNGAILYIF